MIGKIAALVPLIVLFMAIGWVASRGRITNVFLGEVLLVALGLAVAGQFLFLAKQSIESRRRSAWILVCMAVVSIVSIVVLVPAYPRLATLIVAVPLNLTLAAAGLLTCIVVLVFLTIGTSLGAFVLLGIGYAIFGYLLPGAVASRARDASTLVVLLGSDDTAVLGIALQVGFEIAVSFLLFGRLLETFGAGAFFSDLAAAVMGRFRGGAAKIAILASTFFGTISGNAVANVMTTGALTIPMMRKSGFRNSLAAAVEAVSSTGGQLTPPVMGVTAFLMAEVLEIPYTRVAVAALIPAILYYIAVFIHVDQQAARHGIKGIPKEERPELKRTLVDGWHFLLPPGALVFGLVVLRLEPGFSALAATGLLALIGLVRGYGGQRADWKTIGSGLGAAGRDSSAILVITAAAGIVMGIFSVTGGAFELSFFLGQLAGNSISLLLVTTAVASILLGMGMPTVSAYVILASLLAPSLLAAGIGELQAHLFILYFGTLSMLTPPIALAAFVAAKIGEARPVRTAWESMLLSWPAYVVPFLFVRSPALLMSDSFVAIVLSLAVTVLGIIALTVASVGYFSVRLGIGQRVILAGLGLVLLLPVVEWTIQAGAWKGIAAAVLMVAVWRVLRIPAERARPI